MAGSKFYGGYRKGKALGKVQKKEVVKTIDKRLDSKLESKHHDYANLLITPDRTAANVGLCLSQIPQQTTVGNVITREGDIANPMTLILDYTINVGVTDSFVRVMLVKYKEQSANTSNIAISGFLDENAASNSVGYHQNPFVFDKVKRDRFTVPYDVTHAMNNNKDTVHVRKKIKLPRSAGNRLKYAGGSTTIGSNQYLIFFLTDAATANAATVSLNSRLIFKDP